MTRSTDRLLAPDEPPPVTAWNEEGRSPFVIVADHAGNAVPRALNRLGLADRDLACHIAWDIGIAEVGRYLAEALDAPRFAQNYSRLVIDCNRPPGTPDSIVDISDSIPIPGNERVSAAERALRERAIFRPYHDRIAAALDRREEQSRPTVLIAAHSFTPVLGGVARPWQAAVLYHRDPRFAHCLLALLKQEPGLTVGDNQPYAVTDETDFTIPVHGERRALAHVLIELRQDLIADERGQREWAGRLARLLPAAHRRHAVAAAGAR
ncbi:MAG TPA: N-formylglutamate amidohydrolase [Stellaceae bacterium]|jgi:predicted N-formylglutamate amidohydrolase|nr:N-formylglutamate amidohydrolase [Stellaceae bacterium]